MRDSAVDPVFQATATAFGFLYIHPFQDGNGRVHRCLIHHVLAERGFTPSGLVFPVSSVMLDRIEEYHETLQDHSLPLMDFIDAEFLYGCVKRAIEPDLPREIDYLRRHDQAMSRIMEEVEMPNRLAQNFILFVRQNAGKLSARKREKFFAPLSDSELNNLEEIVNGGFEEFDDTYKIA